LIGGHLRSFFHPTLSASSKALQLILVAAAMLLCTTVGQMMMLRTSTQAAAMFQTQAAVIVCRKIASQPSVIIANCLKQCLQPLSTALTTKALAFVGS